MSATKNSVNNPTTAPSTSTDNDLLPLRDLRTSDWLLRGLFVLLIVVGVASQLSQEITEWLYGAPTQSAK